MGITNCLADYKTNAATIGSLMIAHAMFTYALGPRKILIDSCYTDHCHVYDLSGHYSHIAMATADAEIRNTYTVNGTVIAGGEHSGGFVSCCYGKNYYENCFSNLDVYGDSDTGVFVGVTHIGEHTYKNCFAAGKIEGTTRIGGFFGSDGDTQPQYGGTCVFENCYSTSMVGMMDGGTEMGGFVGHGDPRCTFTNCYAAGEVGSLNYKEDGTALDSAGNVVVSVGGFSGDGVGNFQACAYDKQTTAMCEHGVQAGIESKLTTELMNTDWGASWSRHSNVYPQLTVFTNPATFPEEHQATVQACSRASVSTALLYANKNNAADYDTVRRIRHPFPLTNDTNASEAGYHLEWKIFEPLGFPNRSPFFEPEAVPIIHLKFEGSKDEVSDVAPGIGWLQVDATKGGGEGMRRLRLVPTTAITMQSSDSSVFGADAVVYQVPDPLPSGYRELPGEQTTYDHRRAVSFVTATAKQLGDFIADGDGTLTLVQKMEKHHIKTESFTDAQLSGGVGSECLQYVLESGDLVELTVQRQTDAGEENVVIDQGLLDQLTSQASFPETEYYVLSYRWNDAGGALKAAGQKTLTVRKPFSVRFHKADGSQQDMHVWDPGAYLEEASMGDHFYAIPVPERDGYAGYPSTGWSVSPDVLGSNSFDKTTPLTDDLDVADNKGGVAGDGVIEVYALWPQILDRDIDGDGCADLNIDTDGDGRPDVNCDPDGDGCPDINIDTDCTGIWKPSGQGGNADGCRKPDCKLDTNGDGSPDCDERYRACIDADGNGVDDFWKPGTNATASNGFRYDTCTPGDIADININVDIDGDGHADINIDTDSDGRPDVNVDPNNDFVPDINIDTDNTGTWVPSTQGGNADGIWMPDSQLDDCGCGAPLKPGCHCVPPVDEDGDGVHDYWKPTINVDDPSGFSYDTSHTIVKDDDGGGDGGSNDPNGGSGGGDGKVFLIPDTGDKTASVLSLAALLLVMSGVCALGACRKLNSQQK